MTTEETMNIDERFKPLRIMQPRYRAAGRIEQGRLLDEMEKPRVCTATVCSACCTGRWSASRAAENGARSTARRSPWPWR
jgi:hypothetical protein